MTMHAWTAIQQLQASGIHTVNPMPNRCQLPPYDLDPFAAQPGNPNTRHDTINADRLQLPYCQRWPPMTLLEGRLD
jgi:hypothetical protein